MTGLERGYRRLVALYPASFRKENSEEIIAVLLATAPEGQRRPGLAEAYDLLRGAARMHMGLSRAPRGVVIAVRLMCLGALAEAATLVTTLATWGSIRANAVGHYPQYAAQVTRIVNFDVVADTVALPVLVALWLLVAWGNGRGSQLARVAAIVAASLYTLTLAIELPSGTAMLAPAAAIASCVSWALGVVAVGFILAPRSWAYYERPRPRREDAVV